MAAPLAAQSMPAESGPTMRSFGVAVVMSGGDLYVGRSARVIGYPYPMPPSETGSVIQFRKGADGAWVEAGVIRADDATIGDTFGRSVAVQGNFMAVGAPFHGTGGAVYLFERRNDAWRQVARLAVAGTTDSTGLGTTVALDNGQLLVGAPGRQANAGAVYASRNQGGRWSPLVLVAEGAGPGEGMGTAVAISGSVAMVGAPGAGAPAGTPAPGRTLVLSASPTGWAQSGSLSTGQDSVGAFGAAILLDNDEAFVSGAVHAPGDRRGLRLSPPGHDVGFGRAGRSTGRPAGCWIRGRDGAGRWQPLRGRTDDPRRDRGGPHLSRQRWRLGSDPAAFGRPVGPGGPVRDGACRRW